MTTREEFLALRPPVEVVEIPERALKFRIRGLTAAERDDYEQSLVEVDQKSGTTRVKAHQKNIRASLIVRCLVDENDERMFEDRDVAAVGNVDAAVVEILWQAARRLSGLATGEEEVPTSAQDDGNASA